MKIMRIMKMMKTIMKTIMKMKMAFMLFLFVGFSQIEAQELGEGLVSHWPLDEIRGTKTPDLVSGYDMSVSNLSADNLVEGQIGMAIEFKNADKTLLSRVHGEGEDLPANQHLSWTLSLWAKLEGTGQNDLRIFSEGNTENSTPLFNLGTHNGGSTGQLDVFIRNSGWGTIGHIYTDAEPFDGEWHHIAWVEEDGFRSIYIDGELDLLEIGDRPEEGEFPVNNTSIGGILRGSATHWVTGILDEVAIWKRALSEDEINQVIGNGVPEVEAAEQPLVIRSFTADFPAVVKGDTLQLSWDASPDATLIINHGIGDVTDRSEFGVGSLQVPLEATKTFSLTASRESDSITSSIMIRAIDGVEKGWTLIDNFDHWPLGNINGRGSWKNPVGAAEVVEGPMSQALTFLAGEALNAVEIKSRTISEGDKTTLFFRAFVDPEVDADGLRLNIGLTEKPVRFVGDFDNDVGPFVRFDNSQGLGVDVQAKDGVDAGDPEWIDETLIGGETYNIWLDVENRSIEDGDLFNIHVQKIGDERKTLAEAYISDRNPAGSADLGAVVPDLNTLFTVAFSGSESDGLVLFDDFYLSTTGDFNEGIPLSIGSGEIVAEVESPETPMPETELALMLNADGSITIIYTGTLSSSDQIGGPFEQVTGASSPFTLQQNDLSNAQFYIAR